MHRVYSQSVGTIARGSLAIVAACLVTTMTLGGGPPPCNKIKNNGWCDSGNPYQGIMITCSWNCPDPPPQGCISCSSQYPEYIYSRGLITGCEQVLPNQQGRPSCSAPTQDACATVQRYQCVPGGTDCLIEPRGGPINVGPCCWQDRPSGHPACTGQ